MIVNGRYVSIDGIYCPFVKVSVLSPLGMWIDIPFLIDTGADATFLDHSCINYLGIDVSSLPVKDDAGGVTGVLSYYEFSLGCAWKGRQTKRKSFPVTLGF